MVEEDFVNARAEAEAVRSADLSCQWRYLCVCRSSGISVSFWSLMNQLPSSEHDGGGFRALAAFGSLRDAARIAYEWWSTFSRDVAKMQTNGGREEKTDSRT